MFFKKKPVTKKQKPAVFKYDVETYDRTYDIPMAVHKLVGLRFKLEDPKYVKLFWAVFYWFEFANLFVVTWLELIKMAQTARGASFQDAIDIFRMMPCVGYLLLALTKSYMIVVHRPVYENIFNKLRDMWPQGRVTEEEHQIIRTALTYLNYVARTYYWCNNTLLVIFLSPPFIELFKRNMGQDVPLILPFFYWFPFDPFQRIYYEIILIFQTWHGLISIWFMLSGDLLFCIFLCHITTQFDLLSVRIKKLVYVPIDQQLLKEYPLAAYSSERLQKDKRATVYNDAMWDRIHQREITDIVQKHYDLIRMEYFGFFMKKSKTFWRPKILEQTDRAIEMGKTLREKWLSGDVENMFSFALLVNFFNSSIIICFCGFCCVVVEKWNELVYKTFLSTALMQTWLLCWYGQRLLESSRNVCDAIYKSGWYQASKRNKNSLLLMIHRTQKEVHVTTYGFSVISLASYTTIIKTSWSYFTLLLNIYKR